jgi:type IV secretion system protein VirB9
MKTKTIAIFLLLVSIAAPAWAVPLSQASFLSDKEKEALRLADIFSERPVKPIQTADGKVVYVHGSTMPTIIGAPMRISDIELEPGELVNEILVGDATRWLVESGASGGGVSHIFVKPLEADLQTNLVITTDRRVYHLKLVSQAADHTPHVGFLYQEQARIVLNKDRREQQWATGEIGGQTVDLSTLDFHYEVSGKAPWKPVQVYNDGRQTFVRLPESASKTEVPVLLAMKGKREQLVNYRVHNGTFVVDGLFEHLALISGVGRQQERVDVKRRLK